MPSNMMDFLRLGDEAIQRADKVLKRLTKSSKKDLPEGVIHKLDDVNIKAPITCPGKILCLAGNYAEHIREGGRDVPGKERMSPLVFMKPNTGITDPEQPIVIPKKGNKIDWEAELAVVIGKEGKYITQDKAYDYIAGYTIMNDVSERQLLIDKDREESGRNKFFDWLNGKWMDTFAPMGPCLVTKDEIDDPHDLSIKLRVNGEVKQDSNTGNMIFFIPEIIEFVSRLMTLEPGDIISTGTPSGVGSSAGTFLKEGDVVEVEIEKIGVLKNTVEAE
jgi:2,4-diketo-3-deoxy-L-fuconate hydrolase